MWLVVVILEWGWFENSLPPNMHAVLLSKSQRIVHFRRQKGLAVFSHPRPRPGLTLLHEPTSSWLPPTVCLRVGTSMPLSQLDHKGNKAMPALVQHVPRGHKLAFDVDACVLLLPWARRGIPSLACLGKNSAGKSSACFRTCWCDTCPALHLVLRTCCLVPRQNMLEARHPFHSS